MTSFDIKKSF